MALTPAKHVDSVMVITNATGSVLPIASGVKLQPGQTLRVSLTEVQRMQEMMPRLRKLLAAGKISMFKEIAGADDVAGTPAQLRTGIVGNVTAAVTRFAQPNYTEAATEATALGFLITDWRTLRQLTLLCTTAPGGVTACVVTVLVNGVATAMTATLTGTATYAVQSNVQVDVKPGDKISFQCVSTAAAVTANLHIVADLV